MWAPQPTERDATHKAAALLIELIGITKTYGRGESAFQALRGVDLRVHEGEFVAVMGPNGSGKSTVMNILGCLEVPTSGTYVFRGVHVETLSRNQRALLRCHFLGFVFQGFNLLARTSALENVELPLLYRGEAAATRHAAARGALASVGLEGWETIPPPSSQAVSRTRNQPSAPPLAFAVGRGRPRATVNLFVLDSSDTGAIL